MDAGKALAWPFCRVAGAFAALRRFGGRQLGAADADRPQPGREPRPGPRLDLEVPPGRLAANRLEVLEPGVRLLDQQKLVRLAISHGHPVTSPVDGETIGPRADGPQPGAGSWADEARAGLAARRRGGGEGCRCRGGLVRPGARAPPPRRSSCCE